ncbi:hypothetical protein AMEX_G8951 [Astyanax mexicanus]|uniref:Uncharacterized protein n=1 Tax=Astyanax mexicanus TaxID=7994 RepID=A0A8T2M4P6_ASTMX|nr:hypothetical protein AMEX_G8951 [Astyanax mexicanus]
MLLLHLSTGRVERPTGDGSFVSAVLPEKSFVCADSISEAEKGGKDGLVISVDRYMPLAFSLLTDFD